VRTGSELSGFVVGVEERARVDRQATAADAGRKPVADCLQRRDLEIQILAPTT